VTPGVHRPSHQLQKQRDISPQRSGSAAADASPAPDQAGTAAAGAAALKQQAKDTTPQPSSSYGITAGGSPSADDEGAGGVGGPSRRSAKWSNQSAARFHAYKRPGSAAGPKAQPYGSFKRYTESQQGAAAAAAGNPLLAHGGKMGRRPPQAPRPAGVFTSFLQPAANGMGSRGAGMQSQQQQHSAAPNVWVKAAQLGRQATGAGRPGTPWASVGELFVKHATVAGEFLGFAGCLMCGRITNSL